MGWWKFNRHRDDVASTSVGIAVEPDSVTFVACDGEVDGRPRIVSWDTTSIESASQIPTAVKRFVDQNGLAGWPARTTLVPGDYSLRLVERPANVPDEELADATRWLIRDLVEFDVESAEIAILTLPEDSARARTPRMFVVAARHERVVELAQAIAAAGLVLDGFDIVESAMLALDARMPEVVAGSAVLRIDEKTSLLTLSNGGHLYLARNLHVDGSSVEAAARAAVEESDPASTDVVELLDSLLLDIQRSLDYYESETGQAPASRLALLPSQIEMTPLVPALSEALRPLQVETFEAERFFEFDDAPPAEILPSVAIAAGAAVAGAEGLGSALLPRSMRAGRGGFGLASIVRIAAAIACVLAGYAGIAGFMLAQERSALASLESERESLAGQLEQHLGEAAARAATADPQAELEAMRARRDALLSMLRDIGRHRATPDASFSGLLAGLARQDLDGVWLERIEFADGGQSIAIEGRSLVAEDVPAFLRGLGREKGFAKRRFRQFDITRNDDESPGVAFRLATLGGEDVEEGGSR